MSENWTVENIPNLTGKVVIVTGANSGIGYETAKALAEKGATVVMACRNLQKANTAVDKIRQDVADVNLDIIQLDLADLASVRKFAETFKAKYTALNLLINNAGVMIPPFTKTKDGFELQFGANHLGHFALTGLLLDRLLETPKARIVNVSSGAHRFGRIDFADLNWEKEYNANAAYGQSKLANLLFTYELQRKLTSTGKDTLAVAAHPGWTETNLQQHSGLARFLNRFLAQEPPMGALPTLMAATDSGVKGGDYFGPGGFMEMRGYPKKVQSSDRSHDEEVAAKLWDVSQELTGVHYMHN